MTKSELQEALVRANIEKSIFGFGISGRLQAGKHTGSKGLGSKLKMPTVKERVEAHRSAHIKAAAAHSAKISVNKRLKTGNVAWKKP